MQVEWCALSAVSAAAGRASAAALAYPKGKVIRRPGAVLAAPAAGAHRQPWEDEAGRWSLLEELRASFEA
jgi:hypothetical protein